ncbi:PQQ-binding-like beta-propeller repeat protein [Aporhodopirellula aestuarii]|uniref:PQQ-like beta-propeller repeat protein n=1 Tax=Aporhodopirellula aestuarii TaxID=2950107 RepID=A0ABT0U7T1_9BACT|nr:PQQ-binding-like beta-propeller repeat protein [Aporhodopirellula aestuarii]MCM2373002.1 PQQ-like beta-propeller repeat protein [Aporhodopirellula aestuarii]
MKTVFPFLLTLVVAFTCSVSSLLSAEDWLQWRGADRANRSAETGLFGTWGEDGPPLEWITEGLGSGYASVSVADGVIYTTGNMESNQSAIAISEKDGTILWKQAITDSLPKHGYDGSRTTPTVDGNHLYMVSSDGKIVCLSRENGTVVWSRDFEEWDGKMMSGWGFSESPLVDGDRVICTPGGEDAMVVALNKNTGEQIWASKFPAGDDDSLKKGAGYSSAVISHGGGVKQYIQLVGQGLFGIRASNGEVLWRYERIANKTANIPTAIVDGDYVFTSTGYNTGSALLKLSADGNDNVKAEEVYWLGARELQNKHGGVTLVDGYLYCGHGNGNGLPICVEMKTGKIAWGPERAKGKGETSLVYADGHIVIRREDGTVMLATATPDDFEVIHLFEPEFQQGKTWAHPVIANGKLYLREQDKLMCYRLK